MRGTEVGGDKDPCLSRSAPREGKPSPQPSSERCWSRPVTGIVFPSESASPSGVVALSLVLALVSAPSRGLDLDQGS